MSEPIFSPYQFGESEKAQLNRDGHILFPSLLTEQAREKLITALAKVTALPLPSNHNPRDIPKHFAAEHDQFLASIIAHPQMLGLAHAVLGEDIRFDHCVNLSLAGSSPPMNWHTHPYGEGHNELGQLRIFFYVNGFKKGDGNLKVVPGSHLFHERMGGHTDEALEAQWLKERTHPETGEPLQSVDLEVPEGSVIVLWTYALHAVAARLPQSPMRWAVVYSYRNPGTRSGARCITPEFEANPPVGAESLMSL